jgi:hypothetical protein
LADSSETCKGVDGALKLMAVAEGCPLEFIRELITVVSVFSEVPKLPVAQSIGHRCDLSFVEECKPRTAN